MLNICFTFDYEIFFGKNYGTEEEILFEPTNKLLDMLKKQNISATFFIDTCAITQYQKYGITKYVNDTKKQLIEMSKNNQDVQLHIHPHWLRSEFDGAGWKFNSSYYRLQSFGYEKNNKENVYSIIKNGIDFLENTIQEERKEYKCIAYRAGGFTLQPHKKLVKALYENGIKVDSSIAPRLASKGTNSYDYRKKIKNVNWWISSENNWWADAPNSRAVLFEIPVATENKNPVSFLIKRIFTPNKIKLTLGSKRGSYINDLENDNKAKTNVWKYISCYNAISLDAYQAEYIYKQIKRFYRKHDCMHKNAAVAIIGHPKLITEEYIKNMERLIEMIRAEEDLEIKSISDAYEHLGGSK